MSVTYRNTETGETITFASPNPPLDRSDGWEQVDDKKLAKADVPKPTVSTDSED